MSDVELILLWGSGLLVAFSSISFFNYFKKRYIKAWKIILYTFFSEWLFMVLMVGPIIVTYNHTNEIISPAFFLLILGYSLLMTTIFTAIPILFKSIKLRKERKSKYLDMESKQVTISCSVCGQVNSFRTINCIRCGNRLELNSSTRKKDSYSSISYYCTNCGQPIKTCNRFCAYCGNLNENFLDNNLVKEKISDHPSSILDSRDDYNIDDLMVEYVSHDRKPNRNFIIKHWQGDYPLIISYWIIWVLSLILLTISLEILGYIINQFYLISKQVLINTIAFWSLYFLVYIWLDVGLWRSANNYIKSNKKKFWANLVKLLILISVIQNFWILTNNAIPQLVETIKIATNTDGVPPYEIEISSDGEILYVEGGINYGLATDIEKYFSIYSNIRLLEINSVGGRINEAFEISKIIKRENIDVVVPDYCYSAATHILVSGKTRSIYDGAKVGFHQPNAPGIFESQRKFMINKEIGHYRSSGVKSDFIQKAMDTPYLELFIPENNELLEAGVIDYIIPDEKASKWDKDEIKDWKDLKDWKELLK